MESGKKCILRRVLALPSDAIGYLYFPSSIYTAGQLRSIIRGKSMHRIVVCIAIVLIVVDACNCINDMVCIGNAISAKSSIFRLLIKGLSGARSTSYT